MFHAAKLWSKWRGFDPKVNMNVEEKGMHANLPLDIQALVSHALHRQIRLSEFSEPVYIEDAEAVDDLVSLVVRTRDGRTEQVIVQAAELAVSLEQAMQESAASALASPQDFFLLI